MIPVIKKSDYTLITNLIKRLPYYQRTKDVELLLEEMKKAELVDDNEIKTDIIQLHSRFEVEDLASEKVFRLCITPPDLADFKEERISIFSPLGVALFGYQKGMTVEWELPGGLKKLFIKSVIIQ